MIEVCFSTTKMVKFEELCDYTLMTLFFQVIEATSDRRVLLIRRFTDTGSYECDNKR